MKFFIIAMAIEGDDGLRQRLVEKENKFQALREAFMEVSHGEDPEVDTDQYGDEQEACDALELECQSVFASCIYAIEIKVDIRVNSQGIKEHIVVEVEV